MQGVWGGIMIMIMIDLCEAQQAKVTMQGVPGDHRSVSTTSDDHDAKGCKGASDNVGGPQAARTPSPAVGQGQGEVC
eukprot:2919554-Rhodomonas_salina.1